MHGLKTELLTHTQTPMQFLTMKLPTFIIKQQSVLCNFIVRYWLNVLWLIYNTSFTSVHHWSGLPVTTRAGTWAGGRKIQIYNLKESLLVLLIVHPHDGIDCLSNIFSRRARSHADHKKMSSWLLPSNQWGFSPGSVTLLCTLTVYITADSVYA